MKLLWDDGYLQYLQWVKQFSLNVL